MLTDSSRLRDFPTLKEISYLNTAAESIPPTCVGEALHAYWQDKLKGMKGRDGHFAAVESCREISAKMLGLTTDEVSFCSCSSEAYNLLASALDLRARDEVVVTDLDFPAGVTPWLRAVESPTMRVWAAEKGELLVPALEPLLNERTRLVQVSLVSFYNGHRIEWASFSEAVRRLAPNAVISVDVTQALGRVHLNCPGADIIISSTHKWTLGVHGGCIIGVPKTNERSLTTHAGGWYHLNNAFDSDRFERATPKLGAHSFSVGMPNFAALYALNAALRYVDRVGLAAIEAHANPLVARAYKGLLALGLQPLCALRDGQPTGIVAFVHERSATIHEALEKEGVHVMYNAGRIRLAMHGYNTEADVQRALDILGQNL